MENQIKAKRFKHNLKMKKQNYRLDNLLNHHKDFTLQEIWPRAIANKQKCTFSTNRLAKILQNQVDK
jgi:hypothetical protein